MNEKELEEIEARANAATPGPWIIKSGADADTKFCAHAREDIPALIAEVRRLRAVLTLMSNKKRYFQQKVGGICFEGPKDLYDTPWNFAENALKDGEGC